MSEGAREARGPQKGLQVQAPAQGREMGGQMSSADDPERGDRLELDGQDGHNDGWWMVVMVTMVMVVMVMVMVMVMDHGDSHGGHGHGGYDVMSGDT